LTPVRGAIFIKKTCIQIINLLLLYSHKINKINGSYMNTFTNTQTPEYVLFTKMYNTYDYTDFYFDEQNNIFVAKFIGKDPIAETLTKLYRQYIKNYSLHASMHESIKNIDKMKVDNTAVIKGEELNKFLDSMADYLKNIQLKLV